MSRVPDFSDLRDQYRARLNSRLVTVPRKHRQQVVADFETWLDALAQRLGMARSPRLKLSMLQPITIADDFVARFQRTNPRRSITDYIVAGATALLAATSVLTVAILLIHGVILEDQARFTRVTATSAGHPFTGCVSVVRGALTKLETLGKFPFPSRASAKDGQLLGTNSTPGDTESPNSCSDSLERRIDGQQCANDPTCRFRVTISNNTAFAQRWPRPSITLTDEEGSSHPINAAILDEKTLRRCIPAGATPPPEDVGHAASTEIKELLRESGKFRLAVDIGPDEPAFYANLSRVFQSKPCIK